MTGELSLEFPGYPVAAAIDATLAWVNGDAGPEVFKAVDDVMGPLQIPLLSRYTASEAERERALGWLVAIGKAVDRSRAKYQLTMERFTEEFNSGRILPPRATPRVRREIEAELVPLVGAFSIRPKCTRAGIEYDLTPTGFVKSAPLTWAALASAELMTRPDRYHFLMCPGCDRFSVDIRHGKGKRRNRFCSKTCQNRVGQRNKRAIQVGDVQ